VARPPSVRLAELIAALSLATDLGLGLPQQLVVGEAGPSGEPCRDDGLAQHVPDARWEGLRGSLSTGA
jgi:hypothetical protein